MCRWIEWFFLMSKCSISNHNRRERIFPLIGQKNFVGHAGGDRRIFFCPLLRTSTMQLEKILTIMKRKLRLHVNKKSFICHSKYYFRRTFSLQVQQQSSSWSSSHHFSEMKEKNTPAMNRLSSSSRCLTYVIIMICECGLFIIIPNVFTNWCPLIFQ